MRIEYTKNEAENLIGVFREEYDLVRLVDPVGRKAIDMNTMTEEINYCHSIWNRSKRCENCTSLRALNGRTKAYKIELLGEKTYLIISRYMEIEGKPYAVEMLADISQEFLIDAELKSNLSKIVRSYNNKLVTDSLTGLYNRRFLDESFIPSLGCCRNTELSFHIAFMDIDNFKHVNDSFGHMAGDALLKDVAGYWKHHYHDREKNAERIAVRYGGDEILIIVCGQEYETFRKQVRRYYEEMRKTCYYGDGNSVRFSISFGFASSDEMPKNWDWTDLITLADKRMYMEKQKKSNSENKEL